eukprot:GDKI01007752.1.p1 GENE.GDKI01007752.1~~GDKI01007752.1.p1  ORF type:complete len:126 (-),score=38.02 GDKI01007752.1:77-454(-)
MSVGIPVKLLHEALGHTITVELKTGELYRGVLHFAEDNMNILLEGVTVTAKDGKVSALEQCYIRGGSIRFVMFPDMLKHAPMFRAAQPKKGGRSLGIGGQKKALAMKARATTIMQRARGGRGRPE